MILQGNKDSILQTHVSAILYQPYNHTETRLQFYTALCHVQAHLSYGNRQVNLHVVKL